MDYSKNDTTLGTAAQFCARLAAADCSEADRESCERWRADPANDLAFRQVTEVCSQIERAATLDCRLQEMAARAYAARDHLDDDCGARSGNGEHPYDVEKSMEIVRSRQFCRPKYRRPVALAAGVVLATVAVWMTMMTRTGESSASFAHAQQYSAPPNAARQVELSDGSIVHIDAGAAILAELTQRERRITLLAGRALFEVAHDARRPFVVSANNTRTVALGTQFEVERREAQTTITLVEGSVAVSGIDKSSAWSERLAPGNQLRVASGSTDRTRTDVDTDSIVSWSRGWLIFRGTRLDEAVDEINRYSSKKITLAEGSLGEMIIAGSFIAGESESIVSAIAEVLPLRVVDAGSREIILFKRYEN